MSLFARMLGSLSERKVIDATDLTFKRLGMVTSKTGLAIDEIRALQVSVIWACCNAICQDVGKVPLNVMQDVDGSKIVATDHPLHRVLNRRPNEWQTSMEWRMTMMLHALLKKGGYSYISRRDDADPSSEVLELIPLLPNRVCVTQGADWTLTYEIEKDGKKVEVPRHSIHSIRGLSWNGYSALEAVFMGREAIALSAAAEETQARLHGQGVRPGGIVSTKEPLGDDQVKQIRDDFAKNYMGLDNAFATLLLDYGLEFKSWAMTGVDAQHLETRCHQIEECCRFLRVFPAIIGYADKTTTFASAEQFFLAHVQHTLQPWFTGWEQAIGRDLLGERDQVKGFYANFVMQGLLRGDAKSRAEFYKNGITDGWLTRNEVRRFEDLNPLPGLDKPLMMANMADGTVIPKPQPPAPAPLPNPKE